MIDPPFVDTHVHFWDHAVDGLSWAWLDPDFTHPRVRSLHAYDAPRWAADELRQEAAGSRLGKVVHVQGARWVPDAERETAWLQAMGDSSGWPDAIVGNCRLRSGGTDALVARHATHARFRGVRDLTVNGHLDDDLVRRSCQALAAHGALCEVMVSYEEFETLASLVRESDITFVLGHAGLPVERSAAYRRAWSAALTKLAATDRVVCKISALAGGADPEWTVESISPWVLGCIDAFGPERCMFGTNWPIDRHFGSYARLVDAYRTIVDRFSADEQAAMLAGTAERVYRI